MQNKVRAARKSGFQRNLGIDERNYDRPLISGSQLHSANYLIRGDRVTEINKNGLEALASYFLDRRLAVRARDDLNLQITEHTPHEAL